MSVIKSVTRLSLCFVQDTCFILQFSILLGDHDFNNFHEECNNFRRDILTFMRKVIITSDAGGDRGGGDGGGVSFQ